jgi:hypothetical protein
MYNLTKIALLVITTMLTACSVTSQNEVRGGGGQDARMQVMAVPQPVSQQMDVASTALPILPPQKGMCQMPKDPNCLQFVFTNASGNFQGEMIGSKLWNGMVSGEVPTSGEGNAFVVLLFDVNPSSQFVPTAYTVNLNDSAQDQNHRVRTDLTTWVDVTSTVQGTMVEGSRPTRAYVVRTSGPHPMAAILQFPKSMFGPKSQAMVCVKGPFQNINPGPLHSFGVPREDLAWNLSEQKHSLIFGTAFASGAPQLSQSEQGQYRMQ